ncbi:MAG: hypothetical protein NXI27_09600 [Alphaproteobacteria bacterium]|nr:hypothetical protein [Alphaproteobacteria bacterium]
MSKIDWRYLFDETVEFIVNTYHVVRLLKIQLIIAILSVVLFVVPGQIVEIYRLLYEDIANLWPQAIMAVLGIGFLTFMLWYSARWMTLNVRLNDLNMQTNGSIWLRWLPRLFSIAPGMSLGLFLLIAPGSVGAQITGENDFYLRMVGGLIIALTLAFFVWVIFRTRLSGAAGTYQKGIGSFGTWAVRTAQFLPIVLFLLVLISPIRIPEFMGTLFFTSVFIAVITFLLSWSSLFTKRTGFPLTLTIFAVGILWSVLDINDNHKVRTVPVQNNRDFMQVPQAFEEWLKSRPDFEAYRSRGVKYPIYVVAAEGGGIYAAHHAASFLGRIQDLCPNFSRHVFAISGISGGSLGSSIFIGLLIDPKNDGAVSNGAGLEPCKISNGTIGPIETAADRILSRDLLSPLVAATLMKDVPQRIWPAPIGSFDRARALEDGVKSAWDREGLTPGQLNVSISDAWDPEADVPALVLNTTHVETGQRVATSPISLVGTGSSVQTTQRYLEDGEGLSLISAAVLSARFTYITPAGTLYLNSDFLDEGDLPQKVRLVDGGYFENSGVDTAMDIIESVRPIALAAGADIRLISLQYTTQPGESSQFLGETLSPIRALLATRVRRGRLASDRANARMTGFCPLEGETTSLCDDFIDINDPVRISYIHDRQGKLPLGWLLSKKSRETIGSQVGWPHLCNYITGYVGPDANNDDSLDHDNDCIMKFIQVELDGGIPPDVQMPKQWH